MLSQNFECLFTLFITNVSSSYSCEVQRSYFTNGLKSDVQSENAFVIKPYKYYTNMYLSYMPKILVSAFDVYHKIYGFPFLHIVSKIVSLTQSIKRTKIISCAVNRKKYLAVTKYWSIKNRKYKTLLTDNTAL